MCGGDVRIATDKRHPGVVGRKVTAMKVVHYADVASEPVAEEGASGVSVRWVISKKDRAPNFYMRVFDVEPGGHTPSHEHPWEHEAFVLEGSGSLVRPDEETALSRGDVVFVRPGERHQFKNTSNEPLRFICVIPRRD